MLIVSMKCILINLLLSQARPIASIYHYLVSLRKIYIYINLPEKLKKISLIFYHIKKKKILQFIRSKF